MADPCADAFPVAGALPGAGIPADWQSALLVVVPEAEPAVGRHRARLDQSAREGVPAHLTVLYPFLAPASIDAPVIASLRRLFARFPPFAVTLDRIGWFGEEVVWLGPRDERPLRALTAGVLAAFPDCPPYGGRYADVVPHLTIGDRDDPAALHAAAAAVGGHLPVAARATEVTLMAGPPPGIPGTPPGQWRTLTAFPLEAAWPQRRPLAQRLRPGLLR
jgi:2'-5' RNA ligase